MPREKHAQDKQDRIRKTEILNNNITLQITFILTHQENRQEVALSCYVALDLKNDQKTQKDAPKNMRQRLFIA